MTTLNRAILNQQLTTIYQNIGRARSTVKANVADQCHRLTGNESSAERTFLGVNTPENESSRISLRGANWPGSYWPIRFWERIGLRAKRLSVFYSLLGSLSALCMAGACFRRRCV